MELDVWHWQQKINEPASDFLEPANLNALSSDRSSWLMLAVARPRIILTLEDTVLGTLEYGMMMEDKYASDGRLAISSTFSRYRGSLF